MNMELLQKQATNIDSFAEGYKAALQWVAQQTVKEQIIKEAVKEEIKEPAIVS